MENENFRKKFTFEWTIFNYSMCGKRNGEVILSPVFTAENIGGSRWCLHLYPRGHSCDEEDYVSLYLKRSVTDNGTDKPLDIELSFYEQDGRCIMKEEISAIIERGEYRGFSKFMKIETLLETIAQLEKDVFSIYCTIRCDAPASYYKTETTIGFDHYSFLRKFRIPELPDWTVSHTFSFTNDCTLKAILSAPDYHIDVSFQTADSEPHFYRCTLILLTNEGKKFSEKSSSYLFEYDGDTLRFPSFISLEELDDQNNSLVKNGTFSLIFDFSMSNSINLTGDMVTSAYPEKCIAKSSGLLELSNALRDMLDFRVAPDLMLRFDNDEEIVHAHRSILSARSPVLKNMLENAMLENNNTPIHIIGSDPTTYKFFLRYLYTGDMDALDRDMASKLLLVAHRYEVCHLADVCTEYLISTLTDDNVCDIFAKADLIENRRLKEFCSQYIRANSLKILNLPGWIEWMQHNSELATEVFLELSVDLTKYQLI